MSERRSAVRQIISNTDLVNDPVRPKEKAEAKSKRINLVIRPSVYDRVKQKCQAIGISVNDCVCQLLENWVEED
ncbi:MAG: hypothetical protein LUC18_04015 [Porphyromonadaceae bacterium]|nr:hypothetical protein [Porphyromonadaceae bacterium]